MKRAGGSRGFKRRLVGGAAHGGWEWAPFEPANHVPIRVVAKDPRRNRSLPQRKPWLPVWVHPIWVGHMPHFLSAMARRSPSVHGYDPLVQHWHALCVLAEFSPPPVSCPASTIQVANVCAHHLISAWPSRWMGGPMWPKTPSPTFSTGCRNPSAGCGQHSVDGAVQRRHRASKPASDKAAKTVPRSAAVFNARWLGCKRWVWWWRRMKTPRATTGASCSTTSRTVLSQAS